MSEAVEWLWEFKRKLDSIIAPKELFDQGLGNYIIKKSTASYHDGDSRL